MGTKLILIGGFLGAGKTTLIYQTAKRWQAEKRSVGIITNDQASALVDTVYLNSVSKAVEEVSGSCFCCNYPGFSNAVLSLAKEDQNKIILAEPVGSCTDLSATILQPLKGAVKQPVFDRAADRFGGSVFCKKPAGSSSSGAAPER